jgi:HSP20 family protein
MNVLKPVTRNGLRQWNLLDDFDTEVSRLFEQEPAGGTFSPAVDLHETEDAYVVKADMPGLKKDDIDLEIAENVVTIKGRREDTKEEKKKNFHRVERFHGSFQRSFMIPGGFDHDGVAADFKDGVLTVTLPKPAENKPKRISVN